jgi:hypothetical protein
MQEVGGSIPPGSTNNINRLDIISIIPASQKRHLGRAWEAAHGPFLGPGKVLESFLGLGWGEIAPGAKSLPLGCPSALGQLLPDLPFSLPSLARSTLGAEPTPTALDGLWLPPHPNTAQSAYSN